MQSQYHQLKPINNDPVDAEKLEAEILDAFKVLLFLPLLKLLDQSPKILNAKHTPLVEALRLGRITFYRGVFSGRFDAATSKELKSLGARWDRQESVWRLNLEALPEEVRQVISISEAKFLGKLKAIDAWITQKLQDFPATIADHLDVTKIFETALWKADQKLVKTLGIPQWSDTTAPIAVPAQITLERRERIAAEWRDNLEIPIKGFAQEEIETLRDLIEQHTFKGGRYESLVQTIKRRYGVTQSKAKFWAQQETALLVTKFKETRYTDAGILEYRWACVRGSAAHPVRPAHKVLEGKIFRWDDPPITSEPGEAVRRNNPGQDFHCRCSAIPVVRKRTA